MTKPLTYNAAEIADLMGCTVQCFYYRRRAGFISMPRKGGVRYGAAEMKVIVREWQALESQRAKRIGRPKSD